eukprot:893910-Prymnesium_polylepis.2
MRARACRLCDARPVCGRAPSAAQRQAAARGGLHDRPDQPRGRARDRGPRGQPRRSAPLPMGLVQCAAPTTRGGSRRAGATEDEPQRP